MGARDCTLFREGSLCNQTIWCPETIFWLGKFFLKPGYSYACWEGSLCIQAIWWPETGCWLDRFFVYPGYMVVRDCMLAGKVRCVSRLYVGLRLFNGWEGSLCSQALWRPETVCWLERFFVYSGYMVAWDCLLAGKVLCVARLYGGLRLYAGWEGTLCIQAIWRPETVCWLGRFFV